MIKKKQLNLSVLNGEEGKLKVSEKLKSKIDYLHRKCGSTEWSGILLCSVEGDLDKTESINVVAEDVFLMDIGTGASTEFDFDASVIEMYNEIPEADPFNVNYKGWSTHLIHSHHWLSGGAYFSSVDEDELRDNTGNHAFYISLIVAADEKYVARISWVVKTTKEISFKNRKGKPTSYSIGSEESIIAAELKCEIEQPKEVVGTLESRLKSVLAEKKKAAAKTTYRSSGEAYRRYYDDDCGHGGGYNSSSTYFPKKKQDKELKHSDYIARETLNALACVMQNSIKEDDPSSTYDVLLNKTISLLSNRNAGLLKCKNDDSRESFMDELIVPMYTIAFLPSQNEPLELIEHMMKALSILLLRSVKKDPKYTNPFIECFKETLVDFKKEIKEPTTSWD